MKQKPSKIIYWGALAVLLLGTLFWWIIEKTNVKNLFNAPEEISETSLIPEHPKAPLFVNCQGSIDAINNISPVPQSILTNNSLVITGWMTVDGNKGIVPNEFFISLTNEQGKTIYVKANSVPRKDVNEYFQQPNMPDPGFEANIDMLTLGDSASNKKYILGLAYAYQEGVTKSLILLNL